MKKITLTLLFALVCSFGFAQTFTDGGGPYDMQNGNGTTDATCGTADELTLPLAVTGVGTLGGANSIESVTLNITHTWNADVVISLQDPSGTVTVLLCDDKGGSGDNFAAVVLQDGAGALPTAATNLAGLYAPDEALGLFNTSAVNADGTWNLLVCDDAGGDIGTVDSWSITFAPTPTCPVPSGISVTNITTTTADLSWSDVTQATAGYDWGILAPGGDPDVDPFIVSGSTGVGVTTDTATGLTAGTPYELFVRSDCSSEDSAWSGGDAFSTPVANDDCSGAIAITIDEASSCQNQIVTSTSSATEGAEELVSCDGFGNLGLWYSFTAPTSGQMEFESGTGSPGVVIYEGACGTLTEVAGTCFNNASGSITGLTPGNPYFAMVWTDTAQTTVDFCFYSQPCTAPSGTAAAVDACGSNEFTIDVDVTDLGDSSTITISNDGGVASTTASATGIVNIGPFPSGSTVVVTLEHESDSGCNQVLPSVSFACPPANDDCATAQVVTQETSIADAASATPTPGTLEGSTDSGLAAEECNAFTGTADDDVWYSFVALTANVNVTFEFTTFDAVVQVYSGACGALVVEGCADSTFGTGPQEEVALTGLIPGNTYYARIYQFGGGISTVGDNFDVKIWSPDTLSTEEFENENAFTYFPNPVKNELTLNSQKSIQNVSVYNMLGQEVIRVAPDTIDATIDMNSLSQGAYFVKVTIDNVTETVRILKQ